jgi:hypothetical protein
MIIFTPPHIPASRGPDYSCNDEYSNIRPSAGLWVYPKEY